jgi:tetratricopeptide (TPR) repeat protein
MRRAFLTVTTIAALATTTVVAAGQPSELDQAIATAYRSAYNLDHDQALASARRAVQMAPNESRAHRSLAAMLWLDILFRRGALTVDNYLGGITKAQQHFPKPPADLDSEFKQELGKAIDLATARSKAAPRDNDARYDLGAAWGLQASYTASVEGSIASAFLSARRAFDVQESVLERDPSRVGAGLVVGTYRYVVSGLALPSRLFAYMAGMGGGKEEGIGLLEAAMRDPTARIDAETALVLIYSREGRHNDATRILAGLAAEYPRNRLFVLEQGASMIRAGRAKDAEAVLTRGLEMFEHDDRRKIPGEHALWLYKRGLARLNQNHPADALVDLNAALAVNPEPWVAGRIRLARGKVHDLGGRRAEALSDYRAARQAASAAKDPACENEAARWLKQPFSFLSARG